MKYDSLYILRVPIIVPDLLRFFSIGQWNKLVSKGRGPRNISSLWQESTKRFEMSIFVDVRKYIL